MSDDTILETKALTKEFKGFVAVDHVNLRVIGGMGSILGSIVTGVMLGLVEGLTKVFYPEASSIVVFVIMAIVLVLRPAGLFGKQA